MKGILLAWLCLMGAFGVSFIGLRLCSGKKYYKVFRNIFPFVILVYVCLYFSTTPNLGFISPKYLELNNTVDFINGLLWAILVFHLFWDGMYMFFVTGFSTGILGSLFKNRTEGMTEREILESYVDNAKESVVIQNRLLNLEEVGFIRKTQAGHEVTQRGQQVARIIFYFKKFLKIDEIG